MRASAFLTAWFAGLSGVVATGAIARSLIRQVEAREAWRTAAILEAQNAKTTERRIGERSYDAGTKVARGPQRRDAHERGLRVQ